MPMYNLLTYSDNYSKKKLQSYINTQQMGLKMLRIVSLQIQHHINSKLKLMSQQEMVP